MRKFFSKFLLLVVFFIVFHALSTRVFAAPSITITNLSPYGSTGGKVEGIVSGVDLSKYYVAVYIKADEVWWTKPFLDNPRCSINQSTGKFSCSITTGGCDLYATSVTLQLLPKIQNPIICFPCQAKPQNPNALVSLIRNRPYPRTLSFNGYQWGVKKAPECRLGPGQNYFSDSVNDVWVDTNGLHLRLRKDINNQTKWYSTEVVSQKSLGYGTYIFLTNSRVDILDPNTVFGIFTWDSKVYHPTHREIDIEFARWGNSNEFTNAQFVVQPASQCPRSPNCSRFRVDLTNTNKYVTTYMTWTPGLVEFQSYKGKYLNNPPESALIHKWSKEAPKKGKENIRFNFWLFNGIAPLNGKNSEITIEKFIFRPITTAPEPEPEVTENEDIEY